jgi:hypothetical protein
VVLICLIPVWILPAEKICSNRPCVALIRLTFARQLEDAQSKLAKAKDAAAAHTGSVLQQVQSFQAQQESIDMRLKIVTASDAPDEAVQRFRGPMEKLRRLELAKSYVELLKEVDDLTAEARKSLPLDPKEALKPYARLKQLSISLSSLQGPAEGAAGHLVTYVDKRVSSLWEEMKKIMCDEFETVLKRTHWPASAETCTKEWSDCFEKLLDLQTPELYSAQGPVILLPMAVMTKPFVQQFRYHFMGNKPTGSTHSVSQVFHVKFYIILHDRADGTPASPTFSSNGRLGQYQNGRILCMKMSARYWRPILEERDSRAIASTLIQSRHLLPHYYLLCRKRPTVFLMLSPRSRNS